MTLPTARRRRPRATVSRFVFAVVVALFVVVATAPATPVDAALVAAARIGKKFYEYYDDAMTYDEADAMARAKSKPRAGGGSSPGRLATVRTWHENEKIQTLLYGPRTHFMVWLGAQREDDVFENMLVGGWRWMTHERVNHPKVNPDGTGATTSQPGDTHGIVAVKKEHMWWYDHDKLNVVDKGAQTSVAPAGRQYVRWNYGEPNNLGQAEHCLVYVEGLRTWNDGRCDWRLGSVVEYADIDPAQVRDMASTASSSSAAAPSSAIPGTCSAFTGCRAAGLAVAAAKAATPCSGDQCNVRNCCAPGMQPDTGATGLSCADHTRCPNGSKRRSGADKITCLRNEDPDGFADNNNGGGVATSTATTTTSGLGTLHNRRRRRRMLLADGDGGGDNDDDDDGDGDDDDVHKHNPNGACQDWECCTGSGALRATTSDGIRCPRSSGGQEEYRKCADGTRVHRSPQWHCVFPLCTDEVAGTIYPPPSPPPSDDSMPVWQIAIILFACVLFIAALAFVHVSVKRRKAHDRSRDAHERMLGNMLGANKAKRESELTDNPTYLIDEHGFRFDVDLHQGDDTPKNIVGATYQAPTKKAGIGFRPGD